MCSRLKSSPLPVDKSRCGQGQARRSVGAHGGTIMCALSRGRGERGGHMARRARNRTAARGESELLRGVVTRASQLQSSLQLDAIVHVIATALSETFGSNADTV